MIANKRKANVIAPNEPVKKSRKDTNSISRPIESEEAKTEKSLAIIEHINSMTLISPIRLRTNTIQNVRKSMGKVTRMAAAGKIPTDHAGKLMYCLQALAGGFRTETELTIRDRIAVLEMQLNRQAKHES